MNTQLQNPFIDSLKEVLKNMADIDAVVDGASYIEKEEIASYGISSVISYAGKVKGRLLLDMEPSLAMTIAQNISGIYYPSVKDYMVLATISELNNIIAGDGITRLNNQFPLVLRLAPPIVFAGKDTIISIPKIQSTSVEFTTNYGRLKLNAAFERGF